MVGTKVTVFADSPGVVGAVGVGAGVCRLLSSSLVVAVLAHAFGIEGHASVTASSNLLFDLLASLFGLDGVAFTSAATARHLAGFFASALHFLVSDGSGVVRHQVVVGHLLLAGFDRGGAWFLDKHVLVVVVSGVLFGDVTAG